MGETATGIAQDVQSAYEQLRAAVDALGADGFDRATGAGWTAKEMTAHVAFWEEAPVPVIRFMLRGNPMPASWEFGSGTFAEESWPSADVHNAREAAWASGRTAEEVLTRWTAAHGALMEELATVTADEVSRHARYFAELAEHLVEHLREIEPA
jgi:hypothetical protein